MTERPEEILAAAQTMAAGQNAAAQHAAAVEALHRDIAGSEVVVEAAQGVDDIAVEWFGDPGTTSGVSPQPGHSPNVVDPLDNSQSSPAS